MNLLEGFEKWDRKSAPRSTEPLVTIQKGGLFSLNKASYEAIGSPDLVELYYNRDKQLIAFVPADDRTLNAYPARQQGQQANYYVAGQMFTRFHRIDTSVARRYAATIRDNVLFVDLTGPSTIATGARARERMKAHREMEESEEV